MTARRLSPAHRIALLPTLALAVAALLPSPARAGVYAVHACLNQGDARSQSWTGAQQSPGTATYAVCPAGESGTQPSGSGLVARTAGGSGAAVGYHGGAAIEFAAPPGASLWSVAFSWTVGHWCNWGTGLYAYNGGNPETAAQVWGQVACGSGYYAATIWYPATFVDLRGYQKVRMAIRCEASSCPATWTGGPTAPSTFANMRDVYVTVEDNSPPSVSPQSGALLAGGWHRGIQEARSNYADNVGIREIYGAVEGNRFSDQGLACDYAERRPCADVSLGLARLNTSELTDGRHTLSLAAVDAAGNTNAFSRTIDVDNHAPEAPSGPMVGGGEGWRRADSFDVSWTNPSGQFAPIDRAHYRICRSGSASDCVEGVRDGNAVDSLTGLHVGAPGDYTLRVWLEDEAGNVDSGHASVPVHLRFDDVPPESAGFEAQDPTDPRLLSLTAVDRASGMASAAIQMRPRGANEWRWIDTSLDTASGRVVARIPDSSLPDGAYELRATLRDVAGNEGVVDHDRAGRPEVLTLPLRSATRIRGTGLLDRFARVCRTRRVRVRGRMRRRRVCHTRRTGFTAAELAAAPLRIGFGQATLIRGVLDTYQGRPIGGAKIDVLERVRPAADFARATTVRADAAGRFEYRVAAGPSRTLRFSYDGDDVLLPTGADARVQVPASSTLTVSRRKAVNGGRVLFSGRLLGAPIPAGGRTLDLQAHYRGAWRTFATPRTRSDGRWRYAYRFGATTGRVVYRFRAEIQSELGYPYELGFSPSVAVVVVG